MIDTQEDRNKIQKFYTLVYESYNMMQLDYELKRIIFCPLPTNDNWCAK